ncbi:hypothetical protein J6590_040466 [Homalodisca vitripennis]|nr:hypothetical protein J6590_040466 [Homalodisca vitripennis]
MWVYCAVSCLYSCALVMLGAYYNSADTIYGEEEGLHPVFIFGAMKRGEPMHHWLENPENGFCQFITKARTMEKFPMVIATKYNVPIVFYKPDVGHHIHGELYEMNLRMIKKLDKYEYLPSEIIARIETIMYNDSKTQELVKRPAIMYVKYYLDIDNWEQLPLIADYHSKGSHGLEFKERRV